MDAAVSGWWLDSLENVAAQVSSFAVENRVVGSFKFGVGVGVGEEAE